MLGQILAFLSLNYFLVSAGRKVRFVLMLVLFGLMLYVPSIFTVTYYPIVSEFLQLATVFLGVSLIVTIVRFTIVTAYRRRYNLKPGRYDNVIRSVDSTASVVVFLVTAGSIFPIFGIPFQSFLTSLGLVAVGLAIMLRDYAKNFIDGFRILYTRDFLIGEYVKTKSGQTGVITDISFRATKIRTEEGDVAHIPNSVVMNGEVVNLSKAQHTVRVTFTVETKHVTDLEDFETTIITMVEEQFTTLLTKKKVKFLINTLDDSSFPSLPLRRST
jgi:small-conductance mechanosensitive channel